MPKNSLADIILYINILDIAMQAEANHVEEQQEEEQFGPQLINKLEVSFH